MGQLIIGTGAVLARFGSIIFRSGFVTRLASVLKSPAALVTAVGLGASGSWLTDLFADFFGPSDEEKAAMLESLRSNSSNPDVEVLVKSDMEAVKNMLSLSESELETLMRFVIWANPDLTRPGVVRDFGDRIYADNLISARAIAVSTWETCKLPQAQPANPEQIQESPEDSEWLPPRPSYNNAVPSATGGP